MRSQVVSYLELDQVVIPNKYFEIDAKAPLEDILSFLNSLDSEYNTLESDCSSDLLALLSGENRCLSTDLQFFVDQIRWSYMDFTFYKNLIPYYLVFYKETSQTIINQEEFSEYLTEYHNNLKAKAEEQGITLGQYLSKVLGISGPTDRVILERAQEDFVFRLIAEDRYPQISPDNLFDEYEAYIYLQSNEKGIDPIEFKQRLSLTQFEADYPLILFTQELKDYCFNRFTFNVNN